MLWWLHPGLLQPGPHPLKGARYGEPGLRDGVNHIHLVFLSGAGVEEVLGASQAMVSTRQVLLEALHGLSIAELCHSHLPNILRHRG